METQSLSGWQGVGEQTIEQAYAELAKAEAKRSRRCARNLQNLQRSMTQGALDDLAHDLHS